MWNFLRKGLAILLSVLMGVTYSMPGMSYAQYEQMEDQDNFVRVINPEEVVVEEKKSFKNHFFENFTLKAVEKENTLHAYQETERTQDGKTSLSYVVSMAEQRVPLFEEVDPNRIDQKSLKEFNEQETEQALFFVAEGKLVFAIHNEPGDEITPNLSSVDFDNAIEDTWEVACNAQSCSAFDQDGIVSEEMPADIPLARIDMLKEMYGDDLHVFYVTSGDAGQVRAHEDIAAYFLNPAESQQELRSDLNELLVKVDSLKASQASLARAEGVALRATATPLDGVTLLEPVTNIGNFPDAKFGGRYITQLPHEGGIKYRYDVRSHRQDFAFAQIKSASGNMAIPGGVFTFHAKFDPANAGDQPAIQSPAVMRVLLTDANGEKIEIDATAKSPNVTNKLSYTINLTEENAQFNVNAIEDIQFLHGHEFDSVNRRGLVTIDVAGLITSVETVEGGSSNVSTLSGFPSNTYSGNYISAVNSDEGDFHYRFDTRHSKKHEAVMTLENPGGIMNAGDVFTIKLKAQTSAVLPSPEPDFATMGVLLRLTDENGNVVGKRLNLTGELKSYSLNLASEFPGFARGRVAKVELVHNLLFSGESNLRAEIIGEMGGLASSLVPLTGVVGGSEASAISNFPVASVHGRYISKGDFEGGASYQYDVRHSSKHEAILRISNHDGTVDVGNNLTLQLQALPTDMNPSEIQYPVGALIKLTDENGEVVAREVKMTADLSSFTVDIPSLNSSFATDKVAKIEIIQSQAVTAPNKRAKVNVKFGGAAAIASVIAGTDIAEADVPTTLVGAPTTAVTGQFITEETQEDGFGYKVDVSRHPTHEAIMKIEKSGSTFEIPESDFVFFMQAAKLGRAPFIPPAEMLVKLTDEDGDVVAKTIAVETDNKKFTLDLSSNADFDRNKVSKIEFIHNQNIVGVNQRAVIKAGLLGLGAKEQDSFFKDEGSLQMIHTVRDPVSNRAIEERVYVAQVKAIFDTIDGPDDLDPLPDGIDIVRKSFFFDNSPQDGKNDVRLAVSLEDPERTTKTLLNSEGEAQNPQLIKNGKHVTPAEFDADAAGPVIAEIYTDAEANAQLSYDPEANETTMTLFNEDGSAKPETEVRAGKFTTKAAFDAAAPASIVREIVRLNDTDQLVITYHQGEPVDYTLQRQLPEPGYTLIANPVKDDGGFKADTVFTRQDARSAALTVIGTPVRENGEAIDDVTSFTSQERLSSTETLIGRPVNSDGVGGDSTVYTLQTDLGSRRTLISSPVDNKGDVKDGETQHSVQKQIDASKTLIESPVDDKGDVIEDETTYTLQQNFFDGRTLIHNPVDENGSKIDGQTSYTLQTDLGDEKTLVSTPVDEKGDPIDGRTAHSRQQNLGDEGTLVSSPVNANGTDITSGDNRTVHTKQKTLDAGTANERTLVSTPVNADGSNITSGDNPTRHSTQKQLADGSTVVASPVDANGDAITSGDNRTVHTKQKTLDAGTANERTLVSTPVNADGSNITSGDNPTRHSTQKQLADGSTVVSAPVNVDGSLIDNITIHTKQKTLDAGTVNERTLVSTPVNANGSNITSGDNPTRHTTQKQLADGSTVVASPVDADGDAITSGDNRTVHTKQKTLDAGTANERTLVSTPVNADGSNITSGDNPTRHSTQKQLADGSTVVASPVDANGDAITSGDNRTVHTKQKTLDAGTANERTLVSTPVNADGSNITSGDNPTRHSTQKQLADGSTVVASPVGADGDAITSGDNRTVFTKQKTLDAGTANERTLVSTPVNADGSNITSGDNPTRHSTQKQLADGSTVVSAPVNVDGSLIDNITIHTKQKTLDAGTVNERTLVSTPVNANGSNITSGDNPTRHTTQKQLADGSTVVASPVDADGDAITSGDNRTVHTKQKTLDAGTANERTLVSTPVNADGSNITSGDNPTRHSTQKQLADGSTVVASPVDKDGDAITSGDNKTVYTKQKTLAAGTANERTLVSTPVNADGSNIESGDNLTLHSTQKTLADGATVIASPVNPDGSNIDNITINTKQKTLDAGTANERTLVSTPVNTDGSNIESGDNPTRHTTQKQLADGSTVVASPVTAAGAVIADSTVHTKQKTLDAGTANERTLVSTPVNADGSAKDDGSTSHSTQKSLADGSTVVASPVSAAGAVIADTTVHTKQKTLDAGTANERTLVSTPVNADGSAKDDGSTAHSTQKTLADGSTVVASPVSAAGAVIADSTVHTKQKTLDAGTANERTLVSTPVNADGSAKDDGSTAHSTQKTLADGSTVVASPVSAAGAVIADTTVHTKQKTLDAGTANERTLVSTPVNADGSAKDDGSTSHSTQKQLADGSTVVASPVSAAGAVIADTTVHTKQKTLDAGTANERTLVSTPVNADGSAKDDGSTAHSTQKTLADGSTVVASPVSAAGAVIADSTVHTKQKTLDPGTANERTLVSTPVNADGSAKDDGSTAHSTQKTLADGSTVVASPVSAAGAVIADSTVHTKQKTLDAGTANERTLVSTPVNADGSAKDDGSTSHSTQKTLADGSTVVASPVSTAGAVIADSTVHTKQKTLDAGTANERTLVSTPVNADGSAKDDGSTAHSTQKTLADGSTVVASPVSPAGAVIADSTVHTKQKTLDAGTANERTLVSTPVNADGSAKDDGSTAHSTQKTLADGSTVVASPVSAAGAVIADSTVHTKQKTLDAGTANERTLVSTPVNADGSAKDDGSTSHSTQKTLADGSTVVASPVSTAGAVIADSTVHTKQKTLDAGTANERTLVSTPVNADGSAKDDGSTAHSTQKTLADGSTVVASPVSAAGAVIADSTVHTKQKTLDPGTANERTLVSTPVNADGSAKDDGSTAHSTQKTLADGSTVVASPVSAAGAVIADSTVHTKQKTLDAGTANERTLVSTPVNADGSAKDDGSTSHSTQKTLADGSTVVASPVSTAGAVIADSTVHTKQKTLDAGTANERTLVSTPVNADGSAKDDGSTAHSTQKTLADGSTVVASPVSPAGAVIADSTVHTKQKTLDAGTANERTLVSTPVNADGSAKDDGSTSHSTQKQLADGSTVVASPVSATGAEIEDTTVYTKQKTLDAGTANERTLVSTPVNADGSAKDDGSTSHSTQKQLADGSTVVASPVSAAGAVIADSTVHTKQKTLDAGTANERTLVSTPVNADGSAKDDGSTSHSTQKTLADGSTVVASPVTAAGAVIADTTVHTKQKTLDAGTANERTLVSTPVNADGSAKDDGSTSHSTQKQLADGSTVVASPVSAAGAIIADTTVHTKQKTLDAGTANERTLVSTPVNADGSAKDDGSTSHSTQKQLADGSTVVASPVSAAGAIIADTTVHTKQKTLDAGTANERTLVSTPVNADGSAKDDGSTSHSTQKTLADGSTVVASPVSAAGAVIADSTVHTKQKTLDAGTANERTLVSTPVNADGSAKDDGSTSHSTQKTLDDGSTVVASPVSAAGAVIADSTVHTKQKTLDAGTANERTLVSTPVNADGSAKDDGSTAHSTQKTLADGSTVVASPVSAAGAVIADSTVHTKQKTLDAGTANERTLVSTPVNADGSAKDDGSTSHSTQKTLADGSTIVASPVTAAGAVIADTTVHTKQKTLDAGTANERTLVSVPVNADGSNITSGDNQTAHSTQKQLADGSTVVASPVNADGSAITSGDNQTAYTKQKTLNGGTANERTLVSTPVNADGSNITSGDNQTAHSVQKSLGDRGTLTGQPVNADGSLITSGDNQTVFSIQKPLEGNKTLISTPVNADGSFNDDTRHSIQGNIADGTLVISPVDENGEPIEGFTSYTLQKPLSDTVTLIATPVDENGATSALTRYSTQETLSPTETFIASPVNDTGGALPDTEYSKQIRLSNGDTMTLTNMNPTGGTTPDTQTIQAQDTNNDGQTDRQDIFDGICTASEVVGDSCGNAARPLIQTVFIQQSPAVMKVGVEEKDGRHPQFGVGSTHGFVMDGVKGKELILVRGTEYTFNVTSLPSHPMIITTSDTGGTTTGQLTTEQGVTGNGTATITFSPNEDTPEFIYYQCQLHENMGWKIRVVDAVAAPTTQFIVDRIGKTTTIAYLDPAGNALDPQQTYEDEFDPPSELIDAIHDGTATLIREVFEEDINIGEAVRAQFIIDHSRDPAETTVIRFNAAGESLNPQTVYEGIFATMAQVNGETPVREVNSGDGEQLNYDPESNTTIHIKFDDEGNPASQDIYEGKFIEVDDLDEDKLLRTIVFLSPLNQVEQDFVNEVTIDRFFDPNTQLAVKAELFTGIVFPNLLTASDRILKLLETTYFVNATTQLVFDHQPQNDEGAFGETRRVEFDPETGASVKVESFNGVIEPFPARDNIAIPDISSLDKVQEMIPLAGNKQMVKVFRQFEDIFDEEGTAVVTTEVLEFDTTSGALKQRRLYDGVHFDDADDLAANDSPVTKGGKMTGVIIFTELEFDDPVEQRPVVFVKDFENEETVIVWYNGPDFACVERQDIYQSVLDDDVNSIDVTTLGDRFIAGGNCS